jgi:hypothetical protein
LDFDDNVYNLSRHIMHLMVGLWCLMALSIIFQLYLGSQKRI